MNKCNTCTRHHQHGTKHTCSKCETKTIYGELLEPFREGCEFYEMTEREKQRREYQERLRALPIDDGEVFRRGRRKHEAGK